MKIAVRAPNWIGDCIMTLPSLQVLSEHFPHAEIYVLVRKHLAPIFKNINGLSRVLSLPVPLSWKNYMATVRRIKACDFNAGILFTNSFSSALLFKLSAVPQRLGYNRDLRGLLLSKRIPAVAETFHHQFYYRRIIESYIGRKIISSQPARLVVSSDERNSVAVLLSQIGVDPQKGLLGISPVAAYGPAKEWLPERFQELLNRLHQNHPEMTILMFGSQKESERIHQICQKSGARVFNLAGRFDLRESIVAISMCRAFVSNDSGLMHVAAALDVPVIGLFGPTDPQKTSVSSGRSRNLYFPQECAPCKYRKCPFNRECMRAIKVVEVLAALEEMLK